MALLLRSALISALFSSFVFAQTEMDSNKPIDDISSEPFEITLRTLKSDVEIRNSKGEWLSFGKPELDCQFRLPSNEREERATRLLLGKNKIWKGNSTNPNKEGHISAILDSQGKKIGIHCRNILLFSGDSKEKSVKKHEENCQSQRGYFVFTMGPEKPWIYRCFARPNQYADLKRAFASINLELDLHPTQAQPASAPAAPAAKPAPASK